MTWRPRPNWQSPDHRPGCTCAQCQRDGVRRRQRVASERHYDYRPLGRPRKSGVRGFLSGFFVTLGVMFLVGLIGYGIYLYDSGYFDRSPPALATLLPTPTPTSAIQPRPTTLATLLATPTSVIQPRPTAVRDAPTSVPTATKRTPQTSSKVYETVNGDPALTWVQEPIISGNTISMVAVVDAVVSTNHLSFTLFHRPVDSSEAWCGLKGEPWASIWKPAIGNQYYPHHRDALFCHYTYSRDDRVRGDTVPSNNPLGQRFNFRGYEASTWGIKGKRFTIGARIPGLDREGIHSVLIFAGDEELAIYEIR